MLNLILVFSDNFLKDMLKGGKMSFPRGEMSFPSTSQGSL